MELVQEADVLLLAGALHLLHEDRQGPADLMGQDDVLILGNVFGNGTVGVNRR